MPIHTFVHFDLIAIFVHVFISLIYLLFFHISLAHHRPFYRSHERTQEELELVFEELLHIAALSHLSTSIKRELASIIVFEAHAHAGTICKYRSPLEYLIVASIFSP